MQILSLAHLAPTIALLGLGIGAGRGCSSSDAPKNEVQAFKVGDCLRNSEDIETEAVLGHKTGYIIKIIGKTSKSYVICQIGADGYPGFFYGCRSSDSYDSRYYTKIDCPNAPVDKNR